jgi:hypothetical protein
MLLLFLHYGVVKNKKKVFVYHFRDEGDRRFAYDFIGSFYAVLFGPTITLQYALLLARLDGRRKVL